MIAAGSLVLAVFAAGVYTEVGVSPACKAIGCPACEVVSSRAIRVGVQHQPRGLPDQSLDRAPRPHLHAPVKRA